MSSFQTAKETLETKLALMESKENIKESQKEIVYNKKVCPVCESLDEIKTRLQEMSMKLFDIQASIYQESKLIKGVSVDHYRSLDWVIQALADEVVKEEDSDIEILEDEEVKKKPIRKS